MAQLPKAGLVRGHDEPIHKSYAIYFPGGIVQFAKQMFSLPFFQPIQPSSKGGMIQISPKRWTNQNLPMGKRVPSRNSPKKKNNTGRNREDAEFVSPKIGWFVRFWGLRCNIFTSWKFVRRIFFWFVERMANEHVPRWTRNQFRNGGCDP